VSPLNSYKVLVTTSGVGSRLGQITDYTNKSLVTIGDKPAIAHIIESYPSDITMVVTLGYFGNHVQEFLQLCYPERSFEFINVDKFEGPGSSLGYSMLQAKNHLNCKFIYHACDSLIPGEEIPNLTMNWVGGYRSTDATNYASYDVSGNEVKRFHEKGMTEFDFLHIGIIGVVDYFKFWNELEKLIQINAENSALNDVSVIEKLINKGIKFYSKEFINWFDIGNSNSLRLARKSLGKNLNILPKNQESVSFIDESVIKFFADPLIVKNRVLRTKYLGDCIPKLEGATAHFYRYKYEKGKLAAGVNNPDMMNDLLFWAKNNLWMEHNESLPADFNEVCKEFYIEKSRNRLEDFFKTRGIQDAVTVINGNTVPSAKELISKAESLILGSSRVTKFHGDFILDNVIITDTGFKLIDWRQDFGGSIELGDMYYDLAKLNHSLYVSHDIVNENQFFIYENNGEVECGIRRKDVHVKMEILLEKFISVHNLDILKIKILTPLIWLNMSPLHHHPFDIFLFHYGKFNLWKALNEL
jgi:NDP-sugar pyrophosphorylase family protein